MRVLVYANCQAGPILSLLKIACPSIERVVCPAVHTLSAEDAPYLREQISSCDIVVHQPISDSFGPVSSESLRADFPNKTFLSFPSIYFGGIFAQLCYLRQLNGRGSLIGPLTEYHDSRIIASFLDGLSPQDCLERLMTSQDDVLGHFETALETSRQRDKGVDIPVMDIIEDELSRASPLYTFNHPSNPVLWRLVTRLVKNLGLDASVGAQMRETPYLNNCVAVVPDAVTNYLGVDWRQPSYEVFGETQDWMHLIGKFYELYSAQNDFLALCRQNFPRFRTPVNIPDSIMKPSISSLSRIPSHATPAPIQVGAINKDEKMYVSSLIADWKIDCFSKILPHYCRLETSLETCVDGGAGLGETAKKLVTGLSGHEARIVAYEPNPSNIKKFIYQHDWVHLEQAALGDVSGRAQFLVTDTTKKTNKEAFRELNTSFVGKLETEIDADAKGARYEVNVVRMDEHLQSLGLQSVDFIKLDLQGGELSALKGLGDMVSGVHWMWIEYGGQEGLLEFLTEHNFVLFDTEYLFVGEPSHLIEELFTVVRTGRNSIGKMIFFGVRKHFWTDYARGFSFAKRHRRMVQTDLIAVTPSKLGAFLDAARTASEEECFADRIKIPRELF